MRRRRPNPIYWPVILTVVAGVAAVPAVGHAEGEPTQPGGDVAVPPADPAPAAPAPPQTTEPPAPPTTPPTTTEPKTNEPPAAGDDTPPPPTTTPASDDSTGPSAPTNAEPPATTVPELEPAAPASSPAAAKPAAPTQSSDQPAASPAPLEPTPDDEVAPMPDVHIVRPISFPVLGPVSFSNDWGACRDGCARHHQGNDLIGVRMQPLLAAVDGTITRIQYETGGRSGVGITVTGADGWYYNYFHVNNDTPGTDDGATAREWQISPLLTVGSPVRAGQIIAYMGDSGNAEGSVPHLHFEIRQADHTPVNPYWSLVAARERETCTGADGGLTLSPEAALSPNVVAVIPLDGDGRWLIDADGRVYAEGSAAHVTPVAGIACAPAPVAAEPLTTAAVQPPIQQPEIEPIRPLIEDPMVEAAAPAVPTDRSWTVSRGESLWKIVQEAYGVSDTARTRLLVDAVFDHNRGEVRDPSVINVGMKLLLPPIPA